MTDSRSSSGRIFVLDLSGGRVFSLNPDGSDSKTLVAGCRLPDGLAVDLAAGYIYWTNMGVPHRNDGSIERADLDGSNRRFVIPEGGTFTPKQLHLEKTTGKLYWSDREGMRVMRANLDGSQVETLIQTGEGEGDRHNPSNWCGRRHRDFVQICGRNGQTRSEFRLDYRHRRCRSRFGAVLQLLKRDAAMVQVGAPENPLSIGVFPLILKRRHFVGSAIGGIAETQEMLDFCAAHDIVADVEVIPMQKINEAYERMLKSDVKYRFSIDMATL
jgi:hypothetical protein